MSSDATDPTDPTTAAYGAWPSPFSAQDTVTGGTVRSTPVVAGARGVVARGATERRRPADAGAGGVGRDRSTCPRPGPTCARRSTSTAAARSGWRGTTGARSRCTSTSPTSASTASTWRRQGARQRAATDHPGLRGTRPLVVLPHRHRARRGLLPARGPARPVGRACDLAGAHRPRRSQRGLRRRAGGRQAAPVCDVGDGADEPAAAGPDFVLDPVLSPDGRRIAWLQWDHPNMSWDGTRLWVASVDEVGDLHDARAVAGGDDESIEQPRWLSDERLVFLSDRSGWSNLYALDVADSSGAPVRGSRAVRRGARGAGCRGARLRPAALGARPVVVRPAAGRADRDDPARRRLLPGVPAGPRDQRERRRRGRHRRDRGLRPAGPGGAPRDVPWRPSSTDPPTWSPSTCTTARRARWPGSRTRRTRPG